MINKTMCKCCNNYTIEGLFDVCPVCFWQRDDYQEKYTEDNSGPNHVSLTQAIANYKTYGAIDQQFKNLVKPLESGK